MEYSTAVMEERARQKMLAWKGEKRGFLSFSTCRQPGKIVQFETSGNTIFRFVLLEVVYF